MVETLSDLLSRFLESRGAAALLLVAAVVAAALAVYEAVTRWQRGARRRTAIDEIAVNSRAMAPLYQSGKWSDAQRDQACRLIRGTIYAIEEDIDQSRGRALREVCDLPPTGTIWVADLERATPRSGIDNPDRNQSIRWRLQVLHSYLVMFSHDGLI